MSRPNDLTCQELVELVTDYLEGALSAADQARFNSHVRQCERCATYLNQIRTTIAITGALTENGIDPEARDHLLRTFRDWNRV